MKSSSNWRICWVRPAQGGAGASGYVCGVGAGAAARAGQLPGRYRSAIEATAAVFEYVARLRARDVPEDESPLFWRFGSAGWDQVSLRSNPNGYELCLEVPWTGAREARAAPPMLGTRDRAKLRKTGATVDDTVAQFPPTGVWGPLAAALETFDWSTWSDRDGDEMYAAVMLHVRGRIYAQVVREARARGRRPGGRSSGLDVSRLGAPESTPVGAWVRPDGRLEVRHAGRLWLSPTARAASLAVVAALLRELRLARLSPARVVPGGRRRG